MSRYLLAWLPMVVIAVANGIFREVVLLPWLGMHEARQASTLLLIVLFGIYIALVFRIWPIASLRDAIAVGAAWLVLTLLFEFSLGYFVSNLTWPQMLEEYDLANGRLWMLVPLWVATAPYLFFRFRS
jgi:hypothetical protein